MCDPFPGIDLVAIHRIKTILDSPNSDRFKQKVFSPAEIDYCQSKADPATHFAGRFAAKEAVMKAVLSSAALHQIGHSEIEITADEYGAPVVRLNSGIQQKYSCRVSISHDGDFAVAYAIFVLMS